MRKILAIDGGGIKGVFPAAFLSTLEDKTNGNIWEYFDLIAGTSTGGIIALALGLGFSAREILSLYEDNAERIFPKQKLGRLERFNPKKRIRGAFRQKYETDALAALLRGKIKGKLLGQSKTRVMILSTNLTDGSVYVFKTAHHERFSHDYLVPAEDIALATSAAPIFFKPHTMPSGQALVDGAMWGNNPSGFAAVEAAHVLGWPAEDIALLSLGCTQEPVPFGDLAGKNPGAVDWNFGVIDAFFAGQCSASEGIAQLIVNDRSGKRYQRYSPIVAPKLFTLDGIDKVQQLKGFGDSEARKANPAVQEVFLANKAERFEPFHKISN
ncbi:MAG: CBASS cGAMP-activated phospholipase [Humidesulfovibrio sp.]|uniref:CBASS cGAMP-activated phospholipase n=1 Tax=Humidesulfovibrio sp. TaxID=2910988 RepID=UPI002733B7E9|nr:CBASS cGAMP-activated phospholipase [Humidesulfovibrio sp.]MDP2846802.1 CBASS cGAMP-activated phospholipase [Humidesulfovibrio sp.]